MLKLYHGPAAANGLKCLAALKEKNLEFESVFIDFDKFEQHEPWYLKVNPEGQVPALDHEGEIFTDSSVINEYLEDAFPDALPLRPRDAVGAARMRYWNKYIDEHVMESVSAHGWNTRIHQFASSFSEEDFEKYIARIPLKRQRVKWRKAREGFPTEQLNEAREKVETSVNRVEAQLQVTDWLVGNRFTLADINYYATAGFALARLFQGMISTEKTPRLMDWIERVAARPAIQAAMAVAPISAPPKG